MSLHILPPLPDCAPPPETWVQGVQMHLDGICYLSMSLYGFDAIPDDPHWRWFGDKENEQGRI